MHSADNAEYDPEFGMGDHMFRDLALPRDNMVENHERFGPGRAEEQRLSVMVLLRILYLCHVDRIRGKVNVRLHETLKVDSRPGPKRVPSRIGVCLSTKMCVRRDNETTSRTISGLQPVANGFIIELVEQEGDDMRGIHRLLSHIPRNLFDASSVLL